jgi:hypothetical protein
MASVAFVVGHQERRVATIGARSEDLSPATTLGMPVSFSHCLRL